MKNINVKKSLKLTNTIKPTINPKVKKYIPYDQYKDVEPDNKDVTLSFFSMYFKNKITVDTYKTLISNK